MTARSTLESEAAAAADECTWVHQLATTLPFIFPAEEDGLKPVPFLVDNLAAISTANHPKVRSASKHVQLRVFRLRDYQGDNNNILFLKNNVADFMSKLLKNYDFPRLVHFLVDNSYKQSGETAQTCLEGNYCYHHIRTQAMVHHHNNFTLIVN